MLLRPEATETRWGQFNEKKIFLRLIAIIIAFKQHSTIFLLITTYCLSLGVRLVNSAVTCMENVLHFSIPYNKDNLWESLHVKWGSCAISLSKAMNITQIAYKSLFSHVSRGMVKVMVLHLNKHEFISPKDVLCQVKLKVDRYVLGRRCLNVGDLLSLICYSFKDMVLYLNIFDFTLPNDA